MYTKMMVAWMIGLAGLVLTYWVGSLHLGISAQDVLVCVGAANLSALISGLSVLRLEKVDWIRAHILTRSLWTWALLVVFFFGSLSLLAPPLRDTDILLRLAFPLILSTGLMLNPVFGPVQDWLVRRSQKRSRSAS